MKILKEIIGKNDMRVVIRVVCEADAQNILDYYNNLESDYEFRVSEKDETPLDLIKEIEYMKKLSEDGNLGLVAEHDGMIVGFLDFNRKASRRRLAHTGSFGMSVHQNYRGIKLGEGLLQVLVDWAKESTLIEKINLGVLSANIAALNLYIKMGFEIEGIMKKDIKLADGTYLDNIYMGLWTKSAL